LLLCAPAWLLLPLRAAEVAASRAWHAYSCWCQSAHIHLPFRLHPTAHPPSCGPLPRRTLIDSFGIPEHLVAAPIAGDWARYNEADNQGELLGQAW
jgi:hypothetical protein